MSRSAPLLVSLAAIAASLGFGSRMAARAQVGDMFQEQAREKIELQNMRNEVQDIKGTMNDALEQMKQLKDQAAHANANVKEIHLIAKEASVEIAPSVAASCYTYNGKIPGPPIRVREGDVVRVVLHNQLKEPTSLIFHGVALPQSVSGLPRQDHGLVKPGGAFVYQFAAPSPGTYFYHPQVINSEQKSLGMYGALIVEPRDARKTYEHDLVIFLSDMRVSQTGVRVNQAVGHPGKSAGTGSGTGSMVAHKALAFAPPGQSGGSSQIYHLMNGKSAPAIPVIELNKGERVRLRVINTGSEAVPLSLSGHRFEVAAMNGSDPLEPHVFRDTVTVQPGERYDLEFAADNPGVWSLASEIPEQATTEGHFPGGIACVVRYSGLEQKPEPAPE